MLTISILTSVFDLCVGDDPCGDGGDLGSGRCALVALTSFEALKIEYRVKSIPLIW